MGTTMEIEFDYCMRITYSRHTIRDLKHRALKLHLARWMATQIAELGINAQWVKGKRDQESVVTFYSEVLVVVLQYRLHPTFENNILTWDRAALIASLNVGYDIDLAKCINTKIHIRAFGETATFPFPCLIQQLCDVL